MERLPLSKGTWAFRVTWLEWKTRAGSLPVQDFKWGGPLQAASFISALVPASEAAAIRLLIKRFGGRWVRGTSPAGGARLGSPQEAGHNLDKPVGSNGRAQTNHWNHGCRTRDCN